jgi:serine/threonine protein kinase
MTESEQWWRVEQLYHSALERPPSDRKAFLADACERDVNLRERVEFLLAQSGTTSDLIDRQAWQAATELRYGQPILEPGIRFGPYEIVALLGHGGMGSVYRAIDTRLDRAVAIKFSAEQFSERFEREARAISALNHPNICTLHDVGANFLVMELVDGETLAKRVERTGPLPVKEALDISLQVADALDVAHSKGVVHCDLKPSNIIVTPEGRAKVLDFGLARAIREDEAEGNDRPGTAHAAQRSVADQILGTPAYMSPEQARGDCIDARTDLWSFGCLLYELLSGKRAFRGETNSEIITAISERDPDWQALPRGMPRSVRGLLQKCLEKDRACRPHDIRVARIPIENAARPSPRLPALALAAASIALLLVVVLAAWILHGRDTKPDQTFHPIPLTTYLGSQDWPSFSPDGNQVAFSWDGEEQGNSDIYVKSIGPDSPLRLTRSLVNNTNPAWSPDGRWIAFLRGTRPGRSTMVLVPPTGGSERVVAEVASPGPSVQSLTWSPDSKWMVVFDQPAGQAGGLWLLSIDGRQPRRLTSVAGGSAPLDRAPAFASDGSSLAFVRRVANNSEDLYLLPLGADLWPAAEPQQITRAKQAVSGLAWAEDRRGLIYSTGPPGNENLWRTSIFGVPYARRLTEQADILNLAISPRSHRLVFAQSRREMDIYRADLSGEDSEVRSIPLIASSRLDRYPQYSPDGRRIAFVSLRSGDWQLWTCDSDGTNTIQITSFDRGEVAFPAWSPDGQKIGFISTAEGSSQAYVVNAAGGKPQKRADLGSDASGWIWSRDGRWIVFFCSGSGEGSQLCRVPAEGGHAEQLTHLGATGWTVGESLETALLYFIRPGGIWTVSIDGSNERQLFRFDVDPGWIDVGRSGIYFVSKSTHTKDGDLMFYRFPNGPLAKVAGIQTRYGFSLSPDRRYVTYTKMTSTGSDLMLIDKFY